MSHPIAQPPMCGSCGASLQPPNTVCQVCHTVQWTAPAPPPYPHPQQGYYPVPMRGVVAAKSPGVAVLLNFLWLGAGNLYAGQTTFGIILLIVNIPLVILSWTVIGLIVTFPVWLILAIVAMVVAAQGAGEFNRRNGILVR